MFAITYTTVADVAINSPVLVLAALTGGFWLAEYITTSLYCSGSRWCIAWPYTEAGGKLVLVLGYLKSAL